MYRLTSDGTPGHAEIWGNEEEDQLAKEASKEAESMNEGDRTIFQVELSSK